VKYQSFIGLEIHIHLLTQTKAFCACPNQYGAPPNTHVCPICLGYPGTLPAANAEAMRMSYLLARALNCELAATCTFDRKNYFYPDMAKSYQLTQFFAPVGRNGWFDISLGSETKRIRIHDVHYEEDAGKMIHAGKHSLVDYNRAGASLLEIVTEPDLSSGEEAEAYVREFRRLVRHLGVCDGNMEEGSLRCDANISINLPGKGLGTKTEVKNINSARFVRRAIAYEINRQAAAKDNGETIVQETRLWDADKGITLPMRTKEDAHDYRYFPDPDLPPFSPDDAFLADLETRLCELPLQRKQRYERDFSIPADTADFLAEDQQLAQLFDDCVALGAPPKVAANWLAGTVQAQLKRTERRVADSHISPQRLAQAIALVEKGRLSASRAKEVVELIILEDRDPEEIMTAHGWEQTSNAGEIDAWIAQVLADNEKVVSDIRGGNPKGIAFLMGQVMKRAQGRADARLVKEKLEQALTGQ
jgi:aspartyl-tRNA(Asn)/glutamyl-tRNA(Gln) amidotransferase subunit B